MPGFDKTILTDVGWDALTDAEAGQHIQYTHLEAGDGYVYGGDAEMFAMTELKAKVMDFPITNFSNDGQGQITLIGVISSKNVATGFSFREIGVRCTIDGGPSILYAVSNAGDEADYIPGSAETEIVMQTVQIIIKIDRAENVTVVVQPGLDVTAQNIGLATVGPGWFRDKQGQILYFKRIQSPKKTLELSETTDLVTIDIPTIDVNLDMFVALGNPDVFPHFSTIQNALNYLSPFHIKEGITVTITVSAGVWSGSDTITVNHPQGGQVQIKGAIGAPISVSNVTAMGGTQVRLNAFAGSFSSLNVGDFFIYRNSTNAPAMAISGVWQVAAKAGDSSSITYNTYLRGTFPVLGSIFGGQVEHMRTVLTFPAHKDGINILSSLGLLRGLVLMGTTTTPTTHIYAIHVTAGRSNLDKVGVYNWAGYSPGFVPGFTWGILADQAGTAYCNACAACLCLYGFSSGHGGPFLSLVGSCFSNSNIFIGFVCNAGVLSASDCFAAGNGEAGWDCAETGFTRVNNCFGIYNASIGIRSTHNSHIATGWNGNGGFFNFNSYRDVIVQSLSSIMRTLGTPMSYGSTNIAPNTLSWDGSFFQP